MIKNTTGLTKQEIEIVRLTAEGMCQKEIADILRVGKRAVSSAIHAHNGIRGKLNRTGISFFTKLAIGFGLTSLCVLVCAAQTKNLVLIWDNPTNSNPSQTNLTFKVYSSTNVAIPSTNWPVIAVLTNPAVINGGRQMAWTNAFVPGQYFFSMTSSNLWGEAPFSSVVAAPPAPPQLLNLGLTLGN